MNDDTPTRAKTVPVSPIPPVGRIDKFAYFQAVPHGFDVLLQLRGLRHTRELMRDTLKGYIPKHRRRGISAEEQLAYAHAFVHLASMLRQLEWDVPKLLSFRHDEEQP